MWMMADEEGERIMRLPLFREAMRNDVAHNETARYESNHNEGARENATDARFKAG
jgi:hypothetical protein